MALALGARRLFFLVFGRIEVARGHFLVGGTLAGVQLPTLALQLVLLALLALGLGLLGVEPVGVHDNFFELGGNSLIGVQLVAEIKRRFDLQISPTALYETPTLRSLSRWIEGQSRLGEDLRRRQSRGERRRRRHTRRD